MDKKFLIILIIIIIIVIILIYIFFFLRSNSNNANDNNIINISNSDINDSESIIYEENKPYIGNSPDIRFNIVLAGILKEDTFNINDVNDIIKNGPHSPGIWISNKSRDYMLNLFSSITGPLYTIDNQGYLKLIDSSNNISSDYITKINELINGNKLIIIDINDIYYSKFSNSDDIVQFIVEDFAYKNVFESDHAIIFVLGNKKYNINNKDDSTEYLINQILEEF